MRSDDEEDGGLAVPGRESHENDESLTEEERGEEPAPPRYEEPVRRPPEKG